MTTRIPPAVIDCNWRTGEGYPAEDATPSVLAWAFLRRSAVYRSAWLQQIDIPAAFRIAAMHDSASDEPPHFVNTCADIPAAWGAPSAVDSDKLCIVLNPLLPSREQLASAVRIARERLAEWHTAHNTPPTPRLPHAFQLIRALRTYDARAAGARWSEIVDAVLIEESDRYRGLVNGVYLDARRSEVRRLHTPAIRMIGGGYTAIAAREVYRSDAPAAVLARSREIELQLL